MRERTSTIGKKYGHLTMIHKDHGRGAGRSAIWLARCDCGELTKVDRRAVVRGSKKTCGNCQFARRLRAHTRGDGASKKRRISSLYGKYIYLAESSKVRMELSPEQFNEMITTNCYFCEIEPQNVVPGSDLKYHHLMCLDSGDYTLQNTVTACNMCKSMIGRHNIPKFLAKCAMIVDNLRKAITNSEKE